MTELPIADRHSIGSLISKKELVEAFVCPTLKKAKQEQETIEVKEEVIEEVKETPKKEKISLQEIDDRLMTIDDFLK